MSRLLITLGLIFLAAGVLVALVNRLGLSLGSLPGDLTFRGKRVTVLAPLGTSLLLSLLLSLVLYLVSRLGR